MTPSRYQLAIFDFVAEQWRRLKDRRAEAATQAQRSRRGAGFGGFTAAPAPRNLIARATAGSGKSTTLRELCRCIPDARVEVVSFSADVAAQAASLLPSNARGLTLHSGGKRGLEGYFQRRFVRADERDAARGDGELAPNKLARIVARLKEDGRCGPYVPAKMVATLVDRVRCAGLVPAGARVGVRQSYPVEAPVTDDGRDDAWLAIMRHHGIEYPRPGELVAAARAALLLSLESAAAIIDFTDMVYLPVVLRDLRFGPRDVVAVDELQDLDPVQRRLVVKMCGGQPRRCGATWADGDLRRALGHARLADPAVDAQRWSGPCGLPQRWTPSGWTCDRGHGGADPLPGSAGDALFVGVGDPSQAIYGWRGADSDSMERCREELDCDVLPLGISYRCARSHVALAREYDDLIEAAPGAPAGEVLDFRRATFLGATDGGDPEQPDLGYRGVTPGMFRPGDAVICRTNAPLVAALYWLMRARVPCRLLGRDFGAKLAAMAASTGLADAEAAVAKLDARARRAEERDARDPELDGEPSEATQRLRDGVEVLRAVLDGLLDDPASGAGAAAASANSRGGPPCVPTSALCAEVGALFGDARGDGRDCVTLCSIHRAKGMEWPRVWWMDEERCRARRGAPEWAQKEARNLRFVASTRAKWLPGDPTSGSLRFFSSTDL